MRPRALLVVALLLVAGCSGFQPADGDSAPADGTVTPAPLPDDGEQLAPGVTTDGVANASALRRAHVDHLADRSYTFRSRYVVRHENGTILASHRDRWSVDRDDGSRYVVRNSSGRLYPGTTDRVVTWSNGTVVVTRIEFANGSVAYRDEALPGPSPEELPPGVALLDRFDPVVTDERTADGTPEYLLADDDVTRLPMGTHPNVTKAGPGQLRALVTSDGFVRRVRLTAPLDVGEGSGRLVIETGYDFDSGDQGPPPWLSEARNRIANGTATPADDR